MIALVWKWLATHAAPLIAAFLIGVMWERVNAKNDMIDALTAADHATAAAVKESAAAAADAINAGREKEQERQASYESLLDAIRKNRAPAGACAADAGARERVRNIVAAANRHALGAMSGGADNPQGE